MRGIKGSGDKDSRILHLSAIFAVGARHAAVVDAELAHALVVVAALDALTVTLAVVKKFHWLDGSHHPLHFNVNGLTKQPSCKKFNFG